MKINEKKRIKKIYNNMLIFDIMFTLYIRYDRIYLFQTLLLPFSLDVEIEHRSSWSDD